MRKALALCLVAAAVLTAGAAARAAATRAQGNTAAQDIAWFNAQRDANGIPAGIVENPEWSADCDKHITYMLKNNVFGHEEDPSKPFYTDEGNWAGTHSVLSMGDSWGASYNPWETAPIHLAQLMDPQLAEMGVADRNGYVCATTWPGMERTPPDTTTVVTYPGDNTTTYASEDAAESPFTPEDIVGLKGATGPNLYVYEWGPVLNDYWTAAQVSVSTATLTGPEGSVPVKWVDHTTDQIGDYLPEASGILMPVHPLRAGATYQASVQFSDGTQYSWTIKTNLLANHIQIRGQGGCTIQGHQFGGYVEVSSDAPNLTVTATWHGRPVNLKLAGSRTFKRAFGAQVRRGTRVCAASGGGTSGYQPAHACKTL
jgi:hypothetical protein